MKDSDSHNLHEPDALMGGQSEWFRAPTPRERRIAGFLFIAFGVFFGSLYLLYSGWWFRWVILALGLFSFVRGVNHLRESFYHQDGAD